VSHKSRPIAFYFVSCFANILTELDNIDNSGVHVDVFPCKLFHSALVDEMIN